MKNPIRHYGGVVALLAGIAALAVGITLLTGGITLHPEDRPQVLATTYPVYLAAQNVLGQDTSVVLTRLDGAASGCLHDYQMSPADRLAVEQADLILLNGAGAESFLEGIASPDKCVDTSATAPLLCVDHHHDHGHGHGEEEHHHDHYNEHLWLSPARYAVQVAAVRDALTALCLHRAEEYAANAQVYIAAITEIQGQVETLANRLRGRPCVLFHDSMAYLAADLGLEVALTLSVEGESGLSAAHLKQVEALAAEHDDLLLLYDTQYALRYEGVAGEPVSIHTAVVSQGGSGDWLEAMEKNIQALQALCKGGDAP